MAQSDGDALWAPLAFSSTSFICGCTLWPSDLQYGGLLMAELVAAAQEGEGGEQPEAPPADEQASAGLAAGELRQALLCGHSAADVLDRLVRWHGGHAEVMLGAMLCLLRPMRLHPPSQGSAPAAFPPTTSSRAQPSPSRPHAWLQGMLHTLRTSLPDLADPGSAASRNLARPALHDGCHACEAAQP